MRRLSRRIAAACLIAGLAGCVDASKEVGTDLYTPDVPKTAHIQDVYVKYICVQAGLQVVALGDGVGCDGPGGWQAFVQAGMNDIDSRCDAYLAWLDRKKRSAKPILQEISNLSDVAAAVMQISGASAEAITIVGLAFGLAANTFTNLNSIVLLEAVDHSTVQSVVLGRQQTYREEVSGKLIPNKPAAIYVLRNYLRLCMPMTIATDINITAAALAKNGDQPVTPLINGEIIANSLLKSPIAPLPKQIVIPPPPASDIRVSLLEKGLSAPFIKSIQSMLCASVDGLFGHPGDGANRASETRQAIHDFLEAKQRTQPTEIIDQSNLDQFQETLADVPDCRAAGFQSAFEVGTFGSPKADRTQKISEFQGKLEAFVKRSNPNFALTGQRGILSTETRGEIVKIRLAEHLHPELGGVIDHEFWIKVLAPEKKS